MNRLIVCGGGHVGTEVGILGLRLGFEVIVVDDRLEYADPDRVPGATMVCAPFARALADIGSRETDYYVIMTHGHVADEQCLERVLRGRYAYVGMMASARKVAGTRRLLEEQGFTREQIDSVHMPIGLMIGSETPAEIAVSVAAQLIEVRSKRGDEVLPPPPADPGVLCTVVVAEGSTPRGTGAWMLVAPDGGIQGTIGGGALELKAIEDAVEYWESGESAPIRHKYLLHDDHEDGGLGMACGGETEVEFVRSPSSRPCGGRDVCGKDECPFENRQEAADSRCFPRSAH